MSEMAGVGVVGLGRMGSGLAISLMRSGRRVKGFDLHPESRELAASNGIELVDDVEALATESIIVLALPDGPDVSAVVERLLPCAREGTLVIDCSTIDPQFTIRLANEAANHGVRLRDAGMAGGPADAASGNLLFMVGCPVEDWEEIDAVLRPIGRDVVRCGETGTGVTLKVVNNLLALTVFLADVEALSIAAASGLDQEITLSVLKQTGASNAALGGLVERQLLAREFGGAFRTALAHKDARIALELASRSGIDCSTLGPTLTAFGDAVDSGLGDLAAGAAGLVVERRSGVTLGPDFE